MNRPNISLSLKIPKFNTEMSTPISSPTAYSCFPSNPQAINIFNSSSSSVTCLISTKNHVKIAVGVNLPKNSVLRRQGFRYNCSSKPGDSAPGENESKQVLDAFFLGKAFAEALNERIESSVGEFLSTVGRLQAEQQKQVQEFQDDVIERAQRAKEKAAREAMEAQGLVPKSTASITPTPTANEPKIASAAVSEPATFTSSSSSGSKDPSPDNGSTDQVSEVSIDG